MPLGPRVHSIGFAASVSSLFTISLVLLAALALAPRAGAQYLYSTWQVKSPLTSLSAPEGMAIDKSGNLYIADSKNNRVVKWSPSSGQSVFMSGTIAGKPLSSPTAVAIDSQGDVYVADTGNNRIVQTIHGGQPIVDSSTGLSAPKGIALDQYNNIYVADTGNNRIVELGHSQVTIISSTTSLGGSDLKAPAGMYYSPSTQTLYIADAGNNRIVYGSLQVASQTTFTYYGAITGFKSPAGVFAAGLGNQINGELFVADTGNNRIVQASSGTGNWSLIPLGSGFSAPASMVPDGLGDLYVADTGNNRVEMISSDTLPFGALNIASSSAPETLTFYFPYQVTLTGVQVLTQGAPNLDFKNAGTGTCAARQYAANSSCTVNVIFSPTLAGPRSGAVVLADQNDVLLGSAAYLMGTGVGPQIAYDPGTQTTLLSGINDPRGLAVDGAGNLYVADMGSGGIIQVTPSGTHTEYANVGEPMALAIDGAGYLYTSDPNFGIDQIGGPDLWGPFGGADGIAYYFAPSVLYIDDAGNMYSSLLQANGINFASLSSGAPDSSIIPFPSLSFLYLDILAAGATADSNGDLYLVDGNEWLVWKVTPAGDWSLVGSGYNRPAGIALDGQNNVYVADMGNNRVVRVTPAGVQTTVGSGLSMPSAVTVDAKGNIYVADVGDSRIVKINRSTPPSMSFASTVVGKTSSDSPKEVTIENIGNAALTFPTPASGHNASLSANFSFGSATTCPELTASSAPATLAAGKSCLYAVSFTPTASGTISGTLTMTDNNLNGNKVTQSIILGGTGAAAAVKVTWAKPAAIAAGTPLSTKQLDATAAVPGKFVYSPVAGAKLTKGTHTLTTIFTPEDTQRYKKTTASVSIVVE